jgi:hypothetical protein
MANDITEKADEQVASNVTRLEQWRRLSCWALSSAGSLAGRYHEGRWRARKTLAGYDDRRATGVCFAAVAALTPHYFSVLS